jgi:hypothetical protein
MISGDNPPSSPHAGNAIDMRKIIMGKTLYDAMSIMTPSLDMHFNINFIINLNHFGIAVNVME